MTAPTNGAAGIIARSAHYAARFLPGGERRRGPVPAHRGCGGRAVQKNASISGAEVGCQGEVGSACAMAAAGLAGNHRAHRAGRERRGDRHREKLYHNLGLTCDPVGGLVQIYLERNAVASVERSPRRMALRHGVHHVSLDKAIETTMREDSADMKDKYRRPPAAGWP
ncbi:hypothetical protein HBB16_02180 [Pseudonocardia sp. MCCB 268]|nr:hypothetical protein [Pseudonocardia cytotoxica]